MRETAGDLAREAAASIGARRVRTLLTSAGIALGVAAFLGATILAEAAANSIETRLEQVAVTTVTLRLDVFTEADVVGIVERAERNMVELEDVTAVGTSVDLTKTVQGTTRNPALNRSPDAIPTLAVSAGFPSTVDAVPTAGPIDGFGSLRGQTAFTGDLAAERLGLGTQPAGQTVFVAGRPFQLLGSASRGAIDKRVSEAVVIPLRAAVDFGWVEGVADEVIVVVRTEPGRAHDLADRARVLAWPEKPERVSVSVAADPRQLRSGIASDTLLLVSALSLLLLVVGVFSVANVMLTSVMERLNEIGLRRALGASRMVVGELLLIESSAIGLFGGLAGSVLAVIASAITAQVQGWPLALPALRLLLAPVVGAAVGGMAGLYPAMRAARVDPVTTLRGGL